MNTTTVLSDRAPFVCISVLQLCTHSRSAIYEFSTHCAAKIFPTLERLSGQGYALFLRGSCAMELVVL